MNCRQQNLNTNYKHPYHRRIRFVGANLSKALSTAFKHYLIAVDLVQLVAQSPPVYPVGCNPFGAELFRHYSEFVPWDELHTPGNKKIDAIIHLAGNTD